MPTFPFGHYFAVDRQRDLPLPEVQLAPVGNEFAMNKTAVVNAIAQPVEECHVVRIIEAAGDGLDGGARIDGGGDFLPCVGGRTGWHVVPKSKRRFAIDAALWDVRGGNLRR